MGRVHSPLTTTITKTPLGLWAGGEQCSGVGGVGKAGIMGLGCRVVKAPVISGGRQSGAGAIARARALCSGAVAAWLKLPMHSLRAVSCSTALRRSGAEAVPGGGAE